MADKNFGVRRVELIGSSGTPNITSPNNLNLNANTVAISTDLIIGGQVNSDIIVAIGQSVGIGSTQPTSPLDVKGTINADYFDIENFNVTGILTASNVDLGTSTLDNLNVSGVSTFQGDVNLGDDDKLRLGAGTFYGNDLEIYHSSSLNANFIDSNVSNSVGLYIRTTIGNIEFKLKNKADNALKLIEDGAVELYYDSSKKLETTGVGATVFGTLETQQLNVTGVSTFNNNIDMEGDIIFGTQGDKLIFTSSNFPASGGSIEIATNGANYATIAGNSKQLRIFNDTDSAYSIDMRAGKYSWKDENADYYASCSNGSVKLYHPGTSGGILDQKFETTGAGVTVTGTAFSNQLNVSGVSTFQDHVVIGDGKSIQIGPTGDQLSLEYDSAGLGLIRQNNNLFLLSPTITVGNLDSSKISAAFSPTGSVELYHNNSLKFTTQNTGVTVTGNVNATTATFTGTGAVGLNTGTTAQRPASPDAGMIRYNSENEQFEGYSSSWGSLGGASGSGGDAVFYENDNTVTTSYTITSGKNAMSAGPITIGAGATVTIPAGSVWTIV